MRHHQRVDRSYRPGITDRPPRAARKRSPIRLLWY